MSLDLDPRQRALLQEMGVTVWWPNAALAALAPVTPLENDANVPAHVLRNNAINNISIHALSTGTVAELPLNSLKNPPVDQSVASHTVQGVASMAWHELHQAVTTCRACALCAGRKNAVFGTPSAALHQARAPRADWLIVGDGPSEGDDASADIFTGEAGALLDNMLKAMGLARSAVVLTHAVKCRPAGGRSPAAQELAQCGLYLQRQIELVQPKMVLAMGRIAAMALLQSTLPDVAALPLGKLRGQVHQISVAGQAYGLVVSYPPATLLRSPADKAKAWADLCMAMASVQKSS